MKRLKLIPPHRLEIGAVHVVTLLPLLSVLFRRSSSRGGIGFVCVIHRRCFRCARFDMFPYIPN